MRSLQAKLVAAFVGITVVALAVASGMLVYLRKESQEEQALNRVAALSPAVAEEMLRASAQPRPAGPADSWALVEFAARRHGVRVLLVDGAGQVVADSGRDLTGQQLGGPDSALIPTSAGPPRRMAAFQSWEPRGGAPGSGLTFITSPFAARFFAELPVASAVPPGEDLSLVLAVPNSRVSDAWQDLVPAILVSAAVALPVAVLMALLLSRYITRPIRQLTRATNQLADGTFDVDVPSGRGDEFGELARAFTTMAGRVGASQAEMRSMVANVSHDLKTPLTSILGFSQAIRSGAVTGGESAHAGDVIHEEATRLATRLDDILAVAELDGSATVLVAEPVAFGDVASHVVERLTPMADAAGHSLHSWFERGAIVRADRAKLERAIENIVVNAIRHAPRGSSISVMSGASETSTWLEVRNPAPDLDAADLPRLFERFYRRDRNRRGQGSGLGLPIARDIAIAHGGSLSAALEGPDVVFRMELPRAGS